MGACTSRRVRAKALEAVKADGLALRVTAADLKQDREIVLAAVTQNGRALQHAAKECTRDREIVLAAVTQNGNALEHAAEECTRDREIVLAAVAQSGGALEYAAEECKRDREIVLAAIPHVRSPALQLPRLSRLIGAECWRDREMVLAMVTRNGFALQHVPDNLKADREIVLAAVQQDEEALGFAAEVLLLDDTFAPEAKARCFILKICMLSGWYTHVVSQQDSGDRAEDIIDFCYWKLKLDRSGVEDLVDTGSDELVPAQAYVRDWPGIRPLGEVSEYQLIGGSEANVEVM